MGNRSQMIKKIVTGKCLIAADIDKTYVEQGKPEEKTSFLIDLSPKLNKAANLGTNLAVITGNSMDELSKRFLSWFIQQLCTTNSFHTIDQLHLFCNSGGIYIHFSKKDEAIKQFLSVEDCDYKEIMKQITYDENDKLHIRPEFIQNDYIQKTMIPDKDSALIVHILDKIWEEYKNYINTNIEKLKEEYYIFEEPPKKTQRSFYDFIDRNTNEIHDYILGVDKREIKNKCNENISTFTAQVTLKPILSWHYAKEKKNKFKNDERTEIVKKIQQELDSIGLSQYCVREGGRSSIDITLEKVDKAYALEYLIDKLNIGGQRRFLEKFGSNTIYLGDEVINGSGNDYAVTRIPGVLVLAVNSDPEYVPFLSNVLVPSCVLTGPKASATILSKYNNIAEERIAILENSKSDQFSGKNAITLLKENWFVDRILEKVHSKEFNRNLSMDEKNMLHTLVTLVCREDNSAKDWISILVKEFDEILSTLEKNNYVKISGLGSSHPDN